MKLVLGTMTFGKQVDEDTASRMLEAYAKTGFKELDTAFIYNEGKTESMLGELLGERLSKVSGQNDHYKPPLLSMAGKADPGGHPDRLSASGINTQLETSLSRTGREHFDLYYLHSPDLDTPIEDSLAAINQAHLSGKITNFGLSNYAAWQVAQICEICKKEGWLSPVCYQGMYNAITRDVEKELFPCLKDYGLAFYDYNPLAGGLLTGKYLRSTELPTNGRFSYHKGSPERYWKDSNMQGVSLVADACHKENIAVASAALRWLIHHSPLNEWQAGMEHAVVLGASTLEQLQENLSACAEGPLPTIITDQFEQAWKKAEPFCIKYFRP